LEDDEIRLRLLRDSDIKALAKIALEPKIWIFFAADVSNELSLRNWVQGAIYDHMNKQRVPFTVELKSTGQVVGSTSFGNISDRDNRLEIGWTWLGVDFQGVGLNIRVKKLLLEFAFKKLKIERVEFRTDALNLQSRNALNRIGAVEEGILRSHSLMSDNRRRDTVCFSILKKEWLDRE
jgi:RimJ/RimL family protein N-acetyltransferase